MVIVLSVNAGRIMKKAHQGIGVTVASFELAAKLLSDTLYQQELMKPMLTPS